MWITVVALLGAVCQSIFAEQTTIRVPPIKPEADSYVCTSVPIDEAEHYITGFKAEVGESHNAHHILLFGCDEPGSSEIIWDCGEMSPLAGEGLDQAPTCASSPNILYAWAHNAPELTLPEGVAFRVGGNTKIQYLVMQIHYMKQQDQEDTSGVTLTHTKEPQPKTAATMLLVTGGVVPPKSTESFETACVIDESVELHPFAYRTHTHKHGVDVSGWIVQENEKGDDMWTLIGRRDPQLPQMFVPVSNQSIVIKQGDLLAARCILKNDENREITIGPTGSDEMCNFYIMYWADSDKVLQDNTCFSPGAPYYYWSSEANLNHIPL